MNRYPANDVVKIRTADRDHALDFATLHGHVFARGWSQSSFESLLQAPNVFSLVAWHGQDPNQNPAGILVALVTDLEAELLTIAVAPDCRRQGVGRALCEAIIAELRVRGVGRLVLEVRDQNWVARGLYDSLGFSIVGHRKAYYPSSAMLGGADALIMTRTLSKVDCALGGRSRSDSLKSAQ